MPAKRLCFGLGFCLAGFVADSLASDFCFGLGNDFGFGFAVGATVGAGVGLSGISEIGAGRRCAVTNSTATIRQVRTIRFRPCDPEQCMLRHTIAFVMELGARSKFVDFLVGTLKHPRVRSKQVMFDDLRCFSVGQKRQ